MSEVNQVNTHGDDVAIYVEPKKRMPLVVIIMASLLGSLILGYGMSTAMVSVTTELNGAALAAWLFTAGNIVQMVMNPLLPSMNAKIPMPTLLLIGLLVGTATTAGIMLAQSMMVIIICRAIAGFSGAVIFANLEQFVAFGASWVGRPWLYSLCYNGAYMLPELVITMVAATILFRLPQIRRIMANETV